MTSRYTYFVRPSTEHIPQKSPSKPALSGEEVKSLYLKEVGGSTTEFSPLHSGGNHNINTRAKTIRIRRQNAITELSDQDLFLKVQNDDVDEIREVLDKWPDKINVKDNYGWSLLMIGCQANSVETVRELLTRGADLAIRDKAGNSARSLVIKNQNFDLVNILLTFKGNEKYKEESCDTGTEKKYESNQNFLCSICNKVFPDQDEHLSSTVHKCQ